MKKMTIGLVALTALFTACSSDDVLQENEGSKKAIGFESFMGNSVVSRGGDDATFDKFQVWGVEKSKEGVETNLFSGVEVTKQSSGSWIYEPLKYWTKGASYWFAGLANNAGATFTPATAWSADGAVGKIVLDAFTGTNDLVYAYAFVSGDNVGDAYNTPVTMNFHHLFSRIDFKFKNNFPEGNNTSFSVSNLIINNIPEEATLNLTKAPVTAGTEWDSWVLGTKKKDFLKILTSGSEIPAQKSLTTSQWNYLIPVKGADYTVTFTITRNNGTKYDHTVTLPNVDLEMGYTYTFVASIDATNINPEGVTYPITFTVETTPWVEGGDKEVVFPEKN